MEKQVVSTEGKKAFVDAKRRHDNEHRARNKELLSIEWGGWDPTKKDSERDKPKITM